MKLPYTVKSIRVCTYMCICIQENCNSKEYMSVKKLGNTLNVPTLSDTHLDRIAKIS